jgi:hypothetical protein
MLPDSFVGEGSPGFKRTGLPATESHLSTQNHKPGSSSKIVSVTKKIIESPMPIPHTSTKSQTTGSTTTFIRESKSTPHKRILTKTGSLCQNFLMIPEDPTLPKKIQKVYNQPLYLAKQSYYEDCLLREKLILTQINHYSILHQENFYWSGGFYHKTLPIAEFGGLTAAMSKFFPKNKLSDEDSIYYLKQIINCFLKVYYWDQTSTFRKLEIDLRPENWILTEDLIKMKQIGAVQDLEFADMNSIFIPPEVKHSAKFS